MIILFKLECVNQIINIQDDVLWTIHTLSLPFTLIGEHVCIDVNSKLPNMILVYRKISFTIHTIKTRVGVFTKISYELVETC